MTTIQTVTLTPTLAADLEAAQNPEYPQHEAAKVRLAALHKSKGGGPLVIVDSVDKESSNGE